MVSKLRVVDQDSTDVEVDEHGDEAAMVYGACLTIDSALATEPLSVADVSAEGLSSLAISCRLLSRAGIPISDAIITLARLYLIDADTEERVDPVLTE